MKDKKNASTAEERLKEALVPKEEQPYELPGNWAWTTLRLLVESVKDSTLDFSELNDKYVGLEHMQKDGGELLFGGASEIKSLKNRFSSGNILYGKLRPYLNKHGIASFDGICSTDILVFQTRSCADANFVNYFFNTTWFMDYAVSYSKGINLPRVSESTVLNAQCPLPPLAEQKRIVERIEGLFSKLDEAKELIQSSLERSQLRRSAILHAAFTGQLTEQWRKENNVSQETWQKKTLGAFCDSFQYGTSKKSQNSGRIAVIRMGNLQQGEISWDNLAFTDDDEDIDKYLLRKGDVLFNRTNSPELVGKTSIYRGEQPAIFAGYLIRINYGHELTGEFLNYLLNSMSARDYCNAVKTDGVNQSNINAQKLAAFPCSIPSLPEQHEIVRILDSLLQKEDAARELCEGVLEKIELTRKSILAQAFRGHLGTNNPNDPSALDLLEKVFRDSSTV